MSDDFTPCYDEIQSCKQSRQGNDKIYFTDSCVLIALDKIKVIIIMRVIMISEIKLGRKGSASRVILFRFIR